MSKLLTLELEWQGSPSQEKDGGGVQHDGSTTWHSVSILLSRGGVIGRDLNSVANMLPLIYTSLLLGFCEEIVLLPRG